jgi:transcriptional regulator with XRE-family HTH domain
MARPVKPSDGSKFAGRIGAVIRGRRLGKKLSVKAAAAAAGVPASTWYHWESGHSLPLDALPKIARALGCGTRSLLPAD